MPRYFITTNASRPYSAGGIGFNFDPVAQRGGSWLGVLALDTPSDATILLSAGFSQVEEIDEARYDSLKKKLGANPNNSPVLPARQKPVGLAVAPVVGRSSGHGAGAVDLSRDPNSTAGMSMVALSSAPVTPPHEPLLEQSTTRRPRPNHK
jgi:hypothetical protein